MSCLADDHDEHKCGVESKTYQEDGDDQPRKHEDISKKGVVSKDERYGKKNSGCRTIQNGSRLQQTPFPHKPNYLLPLSLWLLWWLLLLLQVAEY